MEALKRSNGHARGAVMYIARVTAVGMPVSAAPCGLCRAMLVAEGVRRVVYTENATTAGSLTFA
jgi:deoxycytidylate deaminase